MATLGEIGVGSHVSLSKRYFDWFKQEFPHFGTTLVEGIVWEALTVEEDPDRLLVARAEDNDLHWMWVNVDLVDKIEDETCQS